MESRLRRESHVRFGGRAEETDRPNGRHRASARPYTEHRGPATWTHFELYVILDVYSRCVAGWMVATWESATLAERLIADTAAKQGIAPGTLTVHAERGVP